MKWCIRGCFELREFQLNELENQANLHLSCNEAFYYIIDMNNIFEWDMSYLIVKDDYEEISFNKFKTIMPQFFPKKQINFKRRGKI